jgi:hypothetical protein
MSGRPDKLFELALNNFLFELIKIDALLLLGTLVVSSCFIILTSFSRNQIKFYLNILFLMVLI